MTIIAFLISTVYFIYVLLLKIRGKQRKVIQDHIQIGIYLFLYSLVLLQTSSNGIAFVKSLIDKINN